MQGPILCWSGSPRFLSSRELFEKTEALPFHFLPQEKQNCLKATITLWWVFLTEWGKVRPSWRMEEIGTIIFELYSLTIWMINIFLTKCFGFHFNMIKFSVMQIREKKIMKEFIENSERILQLCCLLTVAIACSECFHAVPSHSLTENPAPPTYA